MRIVSSLVWILPLVIACGDGEEKTTVVEADPCGEGYVRGDDGECYAIDTTGGGEGGGEEGGGEEGGGEEGGGEEGGGEEGGGEEGGGEEGGGETGEDPAIGDPCDHPAGEGIIDCNGACAEASLIGNGSCDTFFEDLNCVELEYDGGDCAIGASCYLGDVGGIIDCDRNCVMTDGGVGDGWCEASLYCEETGFDGGDCECEGDYADFRGPECCDIASGYSETTGERAACYTSEWVCEGWLGVELEVCTCGSTDDATPEMATSDCVSSCDDAEGTLPFCVYGDHWECPVGTVFRSTCEEGSSDGGSD